VVALFVLVVACDTSASVGPNQRLWGFVTLAALKTGAGEHRVSPSGSFFLGSLGSIPNATIKPDSCYAPRTYIAPTNLITGVTYLDAGASIAAISGGRTEQIPRTTLSGQTIYSLASGTTVPYQPGDSVVIQIPGATGGFPAAELRGKSAEPLTLLQPIEATPAKPLQLRWNPATDNNSAFVLSLQYTPSSGTRQEILCAFVDDGVDSIPLTQHQAWTAATTGNPVAIASRLRTVIVAAGTGVLELISTYSVPTPQQ
jgi:hypothetical protein